MFRAVMHHGHLGRAAEGIGSSQPTLSRDLARLEQVLGFPLFDRVSGRLRPTARALALLQEVERSFVGMEHIAQRALALRHEVSGSLRLACVPALAHALVPKALALLMQQHPMAQVRVLPLESPWLERQLAEQQVDLGLSELPDAPAGCEALSLYQGQEVVVLPPGHVLLQKAVLQPSDFRHQRFISLAPGDSYRRQIDQLFQAHGIERQMGLETDSAVAVCAMVQQGLGVAIVNPLTASAMAATGLEIRPLSVAIEFGVHLVVPQHLATHPLLDCAIETLKTVARKAS
jgi:DNA-binding transcriptional LysR family regulator